LKSFGEPKAQSPKGPTTAIVIARSDENSEDDEAISKIKIQLTTGYYRVTQRNTWETAGKSGFKKSVKSGLTPSHRVTEKVQIYARVEYGLFSPVFLRVSVSLATDLSTEALA
jgi:hypothetical protein